MRKEGIQSTYLNFFGIAEMSRRLLVVDPMVFGYEQWLAGLDLQDTAVLILDATQDGVEQIADYVRNQSTDYDSLDIVSHGSTGTLYLGSTVLNQTNLDSYSSFLGQIGAGLTDSGDILIYGCKVASGDVGQKFIDSLAAHTNSDVASSTNISGPASLYGDSYLEVQTSVIEALPITLESLAGNLAVNNAPTFLVGSGIVSTRFGTSGGVGNSVNVQSDGKILVAGMAQSDFALVRYTTSGALDTTFDGDGKVTTDFGLSSDYGYGAAIQTDGKILVAGYSTNGSTDDFALARYTTSGALDTTFDGDGKVLTAIGSSTDRGYGAIVQADGKILVAGYSSNGSNDDFAVARYTSSGALDTTFSGDGMVLTAISSSTDRAYSVTVQADGKILVAGMAQSDFALVRYTTSGALDTTFSGDGKETTDFGLSGDYGYSVAVQADGKILVAGCSYYGISSYFALARYTTSGALDTTFDGDGKVTTADFGYTPSNGATFGDGRSVTVQADGKILVAGYTFTGPNNTAFALVRYTTSGALDTTFDGDGKVTTDLGPAFDEGYSVTVQDDGKILVGGFGEGDGTVLVRFNGRVRIFV